MEREPLLRILVVDDQKLMCDGLKTILESREGYIVSAIALNGAQALQTLESCPADLVLLDIRMPEMNGVQTARVIKQRYPSVKVVMLTTFNDEDYIIDAIASGADGYLLKDMDSEDLFRSIDNAMKGGMVMPQQVAERLRQGLAGAREQRKLNHELQALGFTQRELEIAKLLADGFTNSQIAAALFLSEGTARNYVSIIYEKLSVQDRANAVLALNNLKHRF
jgi:DNA-binding NarL/FixJ family response regulator